jgi:hypothetical protein
MASTNFSALAGNTAHHCRIDTYLIVVFDRE